MKRLLLLLGMSIFAFGLVACGTSDDDTSKQDDSNDNATEETDNNASDDTTNEADDNTDNESGQEDDTDADKKDNESSDQSSMEYKMKELYYKEFEVEITFNDGSKLGVEDKQ